MKSTVLLLACLYFLSGCASIVSGGPEVVTVNSNPSDAKITICNDRTGQCITAAQTPYAATLNRGQGFFTPARYSIECEKEGYEPSVRKLQAGMNGWYWGNIIFGGLIGMLIVDPATGAMWDLKEQNIVMNLTEKSTKSDGVEIVPEKEVSRVENEGKAL